MCSLVYVHDETANQQVDPGDVQARYERALEALVDKLRVDRSVVAVVLWGSLAHDVVWERSDIDLTIVRDDRDARQGSGGVVLTVEGVNIHAIVMTRSEFRKGLQGTGSFVSSAMSLGRMLFTRDEALGRTFEEFRTFGARDRRAQILSAAGNTVPWLDKTQKWLQAKSDPHYAAYFLNIVTHNLAVVEVLRHNQTPSREAIHQALALNPDLFRRLYLDLMDAPKTEAVVREAIDLIYAYLDEHRDDIFGPLLDYLIEEGTIRSSADIEQHFSRTLGARGVVSSCEWLADRGVLVKASLPCYLTEHSRVELEQLAFFVP